MAGGSSTGIVFTGKAAVDEIFIRKSTILCKSFVHFDASQLLSIQCVSQTQLVDILDGSGTVRPNASHNAKANPALSTKWLFHRFKQLDQTTELREMSALAKEN